MVIVLTGENSFELSRALQHIVEQFDGTPERIDGKELSVAQIPDLLMGSTLFADKRLVIIRDLSQNGAVWEKLPEWLARLSDDIQLVIIEQKLDKRTNVYKTLKEAAKIQEFVQWGERDQQQAEKWLEGYARDHGVALDKKTVHHLVGRVGLDQWQLAQAVEKLSLAEHVSPEVINEIIEPNPRENIFLLFELALEGRSADIRDMVQTLELVEEPYKLFGLLSSQVLQLAAIATAGEGDLPTKDFAIHPFVASKMARHAKRYGKAGALKMVRIFAQADADLKRSKAEPWLLIEKALLEIAI